eukprot:TRINITY_DN65_c1_g1_i1.p1 TRINITY_DN65_c1_g1~~TRINITY_DN65_c1_g1_i1.p1  ORF type:complete len:661 (+),score=250.14 TRINITY_DN65_c1_g1_i1:63-2045(+)
MATLEPPVTPQGAGGRHRHSRSRSRAASSAQPYPDRLDSRMDSQPGLESSCQSRTGDGDSDGAVARAMDVHRLAALQEENLELRATLKFLNERLESMVTEREQERYDRLRAQQTLRENCKKVEKLQKSKMKLKLKVGKKKQENLGISSKLTLEMANAEEQQLEVMELQERLSEYSVEMQVLQKEVLDATLEKTKAERLLESEVNKSQVRAAEKDICKQEAMHYVAIVSRLQTLCERLREAYNILRSQMKDTEQREEELRNEFNQQMILLDEARREIKDQKLQLERQRLLVLEVEKQRDDNVARFKHIEQQMAEQVQVVEGLKQEKQHEVAELGLSDEELRKARRRIAQLEQEVRDAEQGRADALVSVVDMRGRIQLLESTIEAATKLNNDLEAQLATERERVDRLAKVASDAAKRAKTVQEEMQEMRVNAEGTTRALSDLQQETEFERRALRAEREEHKRVLAELDRLRGLFTQLRRLQERRMLERMEMETKQQTANQQGLTEQRRQLIAANTDGLQSWYPEDNELELGNGSSSDSDTTSSGSKGTAQDADDDGSQAGAFGVSGPSAYGGGHFSVRGASERAAGRDSQDSSAALAQARHHGALLHALPLPSQASQRTSSGRPSASQSMSTSLPGLASASGRTPIPPPPSQPGSRPSRPGF